MVAPTAAVDWCRGKTGARTPYRPSKNTMPVPPQGVHLWRGVVQKSSTRQNGSDRGTESNTTPLGVSQGGDPVDARDSTRAAKAVHQLLQMGWEGDQPTTTAVSQDLGYTAPRSVLLHVREVGSLGAGGQGGCRYFPAAAADAGTFIAAAVDARRALAFAFAPTFAAR